MPNQSRQQQHYQHNHNQHQEGGCFHFVLLCVLLFLFITCDINTVTTKQLLLLSHHHQQEHQNNNCDDYVVVVTKTTGIQQQQQRPPLFIHFGFVSGIKIVATTSSSSLIQSTTTRRRALTTRTTKQSTITTDNYSNRFRNSIGFVTNLSLLQKSSLSLSSFKSSFTNSNHHHHIRRHHSSIGSATTTKYFHSRQKQRIITTMNALGKDDVHFKEEDKEEKKGIITTGEITLGFIGCGTIAKAIIMGLLKQTYITIPSKIMISNRNEIKSQSLFELYPNQIQIEHENQNIINQANIIFLTCLPQQTSSILKDLQFDTKRHIIISLVSTSSIDDLMIQSTLPCEQIYKMICLPAVAYNNGICLLQPQPITTTNHSNTMTIVQQATSLIEPLLRTLCSSTSTSGEIIFAKNDEEMAALMIPASFMGAFYGILQNQYEWLTQQHSISHGTATVLINQMYNSMIQDSIRKYNSTSSTTPPIPTTNETTELSSSLSPSSSSASSSLSSTTTSLFTELIHEQTPGGLNEQVLNQLIQNNVMDSYTDAQNAIFNRIRGIKKE